jgi:hypothetical protein
MNVAIATTVRRSGVTATFSASDESRKKRVGSTGSHSHNVVVDVNVTHDPFSSGMMNPDASGRADDPAQK